MIDPEIAEEAGRLLAAAIAGLLEDASAFAVDETAAPITEKATHLELVGADVQALASAMRVLTRSG